MASRDRASPSRLARMMSTARMGGRQYIVWFSWPSARPSPADVTKHAVSLARALTIALRSWGFYPPEHPAVGAGRRSPGRGRHRRDRPAACCSSRSRRTRCWSTACRSTPTTSPSSNAPSCSTIATSCRSRWSRAPTEAVVRSLLAVLSLDRETRRARGGPAAIWSAEEQTADPDRADRLPGDPRARNRRGAGAARRHLEVDRALDHHGAQDVHGRASSSGCSKSRATSAPSASCARTPRSRTARPTDRRW